MSFILESLGRGLLARLGDAFEHQLPPPRKPADEIEQRLRECPTSCDLAVRLGTAHLNARQPAKARRAFTRAVELAPESQAAKLGLASALDEFGDTQGALRLLQDVAAKDPHDPAVAFAMALCHERAGQSELAERHYRAALLDCETLRNARERLAAMAIRDGDHDAAVGHYQQLADLDPGDLGVMLTLAALQQRAGAPVAAGETFQRALLIEPETHEHASVLDTQSETEADVRHALGLVERLIEQHPAVTEYRVHLGDLYAKLGEDEQAVYQYNAALELHPTFLEATVKLGTQHLRRQRYAEASRAFSRAAELNDRLLTAFVGLGVAQLDSTSGAEADATFDLATSLAPNTTLLYAETARLALKSCGLDGLREGANQRPLTTHEDLALAVRRHERAVRRRRHDAGAHYRLGLLQRQLGAFHDSLAEFDRACELYPAFAMAQIQLGVALRESGERAEASTCFGHAVVCDPEVIETHYQLGLLFSQRRRFDAALDQLEAGDDPSRIETVMLALQNIGILDRAEATRQAIDEMATQRADDRIGCEPELPLEE